MSREGCVFPQYDEDGFVHNPESGFSLFLQERCKRVFFIRHAEGFHNVAERESTTSPQSAVLLAKTTGDKFWDARLTPHGEDQCAKLKANIRGDTVWGFDKPLNLDLVVVSPLTRTLQTAFLSLGSPSSPGAPHFVATELCRERIADFTCDGRRNLSELKKEFPGVDYSLVESEEDHAFYHQKEDDKLCQARAVKFLQWLCNRPEIHIAVVTHSVFLKNLFKQFGSKVSEADRDAIQRFPANAEMRSIMLCAHHKFLSEQDAEQEQPGKRQKSLWNGAA
jgi:broad specificity phosphatase PhoE